MTKYEVNIINVDKFEENYGDIFDIDEIANCSSDEVEAIADTLYKEMCLIHCEGFNTLEEAIDYLNRKYISKTFIEDVNVQICEQGFYYDYDIIILPFEDE